MKKLAMAAAALACSGATFAQSGSGVTLFGVVDMALTYGSATGAGSTNLRSLTSSGNNTSRLGFRGAEDLGNGLQASFWLESQLYPDYGGAGREGLAQNQTVTTPRNTGLTFTRRSTISLSGTWGEVRLGRDFTPSLYNIAVFDPFLNNGVGTSLLPIGGATGLNAGTAYSLVPAGQGTSGPVTRVSNEISYFMPRVGGVYGQLSYWLGENARNGAVNEDDGTGGGLRVGYKAGPVDVAAAWSKTTYRATPVAATPGAPSGDFTAWNVGGQWSVGFGRLMATYHRDKRGGSAPVEARSWLLGGVFPLGPHELKVSVNEYKIEASGLGVQPKAQLVAVGYVYNLSKRSSLYTTAARVYNKDGSRVALGGSTLGAGVTGSHSTGIDLGIQHTF